jgi:hypothetical protein
VNRMLVKLANKIMASREPDVIIGPDRNPPYIRRWWVIPRNRWFNIYLHEVQQDDDDRALHDHPWVNMSYVVEGGYNEVTPKGVFPLRTGGIRFRRPTALHRLELMDGKRTVTFFLTGPRVRDWGFQTPNGWIFWEDFVALEEGGNGKNLGAAL